MVAPDVKAETMKLMDRRGALEAEMDAIIARFTTPGGPSITGGLVDAEGFPRSDIDIPNVLAHRRRLAEMGNTASVKTEASDSAEQPGTTATAPEMKPKKICCACPDTKKRDDCIMQNGEDACGKFIETHLQCLRAEGFDV